MKTRYKSLVGNKFGQLTVTGEEKIQGRWFCTCTCSCGRSLTIRKDSLTSGKTVSCGCRKKSCENAKILYDGRKIEDHTSLCFFNNLHISKNNTSGVSGVSYIKRTGKYRASIGYKNKMYSIGEYPTAEEAGEIRKKAVDEVKSGNFEEWLKDLRIRRRK